MYVTFCNKILLFVTFRNISFCNPSHCILSNRLKEISKIIQAKKGWNLDELAKSIGYSRGHLTRLFKEEDTREIEKTLSEKYSDLLQNEIFTLGFHLGKQKSPEESEDSYRAKYIKKLEEENALLIELVKSNNEIIKTNLTLVLATVRTISVRQEATGGVALESLARLEKRKDEKSLVVEGDMRRGQIEREAHRHGKPA